MTITSAVCRECDIRFDATFELSALARLSPEDQLFVNAFVRHHGSIKQMERLFGISYPTVKNRLTSISSQLDPIEELEACANNSESNAEVLEKLSKGDLSVEEAIRRLL